MYVVIEQENHPDRLIENIYGPFDRDGDAAYFAEGKYQSKANWHNGHRMYDYIVKSLTERA